MKKLIYTIAGRGYEEVLASTIPSLSRYATRIGSDLVVLNTDQDSTRDCPEKKAEVLIKNKYFGIDSIIKDYSKILYIDCDIVVKDGSPDIFNQEIQGFGAVLGTSERYKDKIANKIFGVFPAFSFDCFVNAGLFLFEPSFMIEIREILLDMWKTANNLSSSIYITDEMCLAESLRVVNQDFTRLDRHWNSLFSSRKNAHFVHCISGSIQKKLHHINTVLGETNEQFS